MGLQSNLLNWQRGLFWKNILFFFATCSWCFLFYWRLLRLPAFTGQFVFQLLFNSRATWVTTACEVFQLYHLIFSCGTGSGLGHLVLFSFLPFRWSSDGHSAISWAFEEWVFRVELCQNIFYCSVWESSGIFRLGLLSVEFILSEKECEQRMTRRHKCVSRLETIKLGSGNWEEEAMGKK